MKVTVEDIRRIEDTLKVRMETAAQCISAKNTVQYVKEVYGEADNRTYKVSVNYKTKEVTIKAIAL